VIRKCICIWLQTVTCWYCIVQLSLQIPGYRQFFQATCDIKQKQRNVFFLPIKSVRLLITLRRRTVCWSSRAECVVSRWSSWGVNLFRLLDPNVKFVLCSTLSYSLVLFRGAACVELKQRETRATSMSMNSDQDKGSVSDESWFQLPAWIRDFYILRSVQTAF
jgi:hypothetical protein